MWAKRVVNEGTPPKYAVKASQSFDDMMARIVKSLRLMGIPLDPYGIDSTFLRYWSISFGLVILLLDVGINCKLFISLFTSNEDLTKNITTANVSLMIHMGNFVLSLVTLHTGLLISTSLNWKGFVNSLHQIEKLHIFKEEDYDKFNIIFRNGIITFLSLILVTNGIGIPICFFSETKLLHPIQLFFISYTTVGILLFTTLGWIVSSMLQILSSRIHLIAFGDGRWGRCFSLIVESVDHLNRCFGMLLLSFLVFFFIWFVNGTYIVIFGFREKGLGDSVSLLLLTIEISTFPYVVWVLYVPHRIKQAAQQLAGKLRLFHSDDERACQRVHQMEMRALFSPMNISAMGLVNVDLTLLPTILGTCLTYTIVMIQFKSSEVNCAATISL